MREKIDADIQRSLHLIELNGIVERWYNAPHAARDEGNGFFNAFYGQQIVAKGVKTSKTPRFQSMYVHRVIDVDTRGVVGPLYVSLAYGNLSLDPNSITPTSAARAAELYVRLVFTSKTPRRPVRVTGTETRPKLMNLLRTEVAAFVKTHGPRAQMWCEYDPFLCETWASMLPPLTCEGGDVIIRKFPLMADRDVHVIAQKELDLQSQVVVFVAFPPALVELIRKRGTAETMERYKRISDKLLQQCTPRMWG